MSRPPSSASQTEPQGRDEAFKQVCTLLGAQSRLLKFETGSMRVDAELVGATDDLIRESEPQLVITHARSGIQNQDHIALHDAVRLSTSLAKSCDRAWG